MNPYSLKRARRRILPWLPRGNGFCHDRGKLSCGANSSPRSSRNNRCCNLFSKPFFAMVSYDLPNFLLGCLRQPLASREPAARVHAHVERRVVTEAEAARGVVELRRGDAEVEQDAVGANDAGAGRELGEAAEPPVQDAKARVTYLSSRGHRLRIAIERQQPSRLSQPRQDQPGMSAPPERAVDVAAVAAHIQTIYCLLRKNRGV